MNPPTALIAEDEDLLAQALQSELHRLWPELKILAVAPDGPSAVTQALQHLPAMLFLDIRMPGLSGLDAAQAIVEEWPHDHPLPLMVFVTAYDQYALQAFDHAAIDYVLKPVKPARLALTCDRLKAALHQPPGPSVSPPEAPMIQQLRALLESPLHRPATQSPLQVIQAAVGSTIHMIPVTEVVYFEAADKYVRVLTAHKDYLIRTSLKELTPQLDEQCFWQVHRGVVVQATCIDHAVRDEAGRVHLRLRDRPEKIPVSRIYASRFKGM
ncbi:MAG TPA: LytTR family DNA-binding domain-containing protein [Aquabacterium sp.]|nr:LytTR family DNA-binding domain-containing protein [Aquabacterium sp.]HRH28639.1 LytTR family DNA-binding domain-containing protein [Aquabacterium sp.]